MELKQGSFKLYLIYAICCLTFFASQGARAQEAEPSSQSEPESESQIEPALDPLQTALLRLRQNGNPNSTAFADRMERLVTSGELILRFESTAMALEGDSSCGWVDVNENTLNTLHLVTDERCMRIIHITFPHEYEHIRIYREEVFANLLDLKRRHVAVTQESFEKKEVEFYRGYKLYGQKMNSNPVFNETQTHDFYSYLLFKIYTESKAYATTRSHVGNFVLRGLTDIEISTTLTRSYVGALLPANFVNTLVTLSNSAVNYDDYIQKTAAFRTTTFISANLNLSAPAH